MDIKLIYAPDAVEDLESAVARPTRVLPREIIEQALSQISDVLDWGHEFSRDTEQLEVELPTESNRSGKFWLRITKKPAGTLEITVPNPNWDGATFELEADVNASLKVWKISYLDLNGVPVLDR